MKNSESSPPTKLLERVGWYSIGINIFLTLLNLAISIASGSLAVAAEMVHNLVDLMASIAVLVGLKLSRRESRDFPYGLYKVENVVAVSIALLIFAPHESVRLGSQTITLAVASKQKTVHTCVNHRRCCHDKP